VSSSKYDTPSTSTVLSVGVRVYIHSLDWWVGGGSSLVLQTVSTSEYVGPAPIDDSFFQSKLIC
jgi:hypothetical protein